MTKKKAPNIHEPAPQVVFGNWQPKPPVPPAPTCAVVVHKDSSLFYTALGIAIVAILSVAAIAIIAVICIMVYGGYRFHQPAPSSTVVVTPAPPTPEQQHLAALEKEHEQHVRDEATARQKALVAAEAERKKLLTDNIGLDHALADAQMQAAYQAGQTKAALDAAYLKGKLDAKPPVLNIQVRPVAPNLPVAGEHAAAPEPSIVCPPKVDGHMEKGHKEGGPLDFPGWRRH